MRNATTTITASDEFIPFTDLQEISLALVPILSAILSIFGSSRIIHLIRKEGKLDCQKRILLGMSVTDIMLSVTFSLQSFAPPRDSSPRVWAAGTDRTCKSIGFFHSLGASAIWYNQMLCLYYLLTIRFGKKEDVLRKYYEPFMHAWALGYPLITASLGSVLDVYHEIERTPGCWLNHPSHCNGNVTSDPTVDDCKTQEVQLMSLLLKTFPIPVAFIFVFVSNIVIFWHVKRTTTRWDRRELSGSFTSDMSDTQRRRLTQVRNQCLFYVLASWIPFLWNVLINVVDLASGLEREEMTKLFVLFLLQAFFLPLTGFLNLLVYLRPRYVHCRGRFPEESRWKSVRRVLAGGGFQPQRSTRRISTNAKKKRRSSLFPRFNWGGGSFLAAPSDQSKSQPFDLKKKTNQEPDKLEEKSVQPPHLLPHEQPIHEESDDKEGSNISVHDKYEDDGNQLGEGGALVDDNVSAEGT